MLVLILTLEDHTFPPKITCYDALLTSRQYLGFSIEHKLNEDPESPTFRLAYGRRALTSPYGVDARS